MAYFDAAYDVGRGAGVPQPGRRLDRLERDVLLLSRGDTRWSLHPPGPARRLVARLFGRAAPNRLADPRLEALRRFAVLLRRHGPRLRAEEEARLVAAGYDAGRIAQARRLIASEPRRRAPLRAVDLLMLAVLLLMAIGSFELVAGEVGDRMIGAILLTVAMLAFAPIATLPDPRD
jgi:hypothetical protein